MSRKKTKYKTNFLLPKNNFWVGLGSILNIAGSYFNYNYSKTAQEADYRAIYSDWKNIGDDLKISMENF